MGQANKLKPEEVVQRWNDAVTVGTLANWRAKGKGPPFVKFGTRVRYPLEKLIQWEAKHEHLTPANDNEPAN